jgi:hypothetical protein
MFLKRLSAALVTITCLGWAALGAASQTLTTATNYGKEKSVLAPLAPIDIISDSVCNGASTGVFDVTYTGAKTVSSYQILSYPGGLPIGTSHTVSSNHFKTTAQPLPAGNYRIDLTLSDLTHEQAVKEIFQANSVLVLNAIVQNPLCSNGKGTITLTGAGGFPPYTYTLSLQSTGAVIPQSAYGVYSNLVGGQYHAVVKDKIGCEESYNLGSLVITIPPAIAAPVISIDSIDYYNDKAAINLSGLPSDPTNYQILLDGRSVGVINGTSAVINDVSAGSHRLKIQSNSCPATDVWPDAAGQLINIIDYSQINFSWSPNTNPNSVSISCYGSDTTLSVTVNGGRSGKTVKLVLLENGIIRELATALPFGVPYPISDLIAGIEYVLIAITDDPNPMRYQFTIQGPTTPFEIADVTPTDVSCSGAIDGKASVSRIGGTLPIRYSINNGLSFPAQLPANNTITGLAGNMSYNIILKDSKGCLSDTFSVSISEPDPLSISVLTNLTEQLTCPNSNMGKIIARAYGGTKPYFFTLKKGGVVVSPYLNYLGGDTVVFSNLTAGNYEVSVKDGVCPTTVNDVEVIDSLNVRMNIAFEPIKCNNGTTNIYVSASGGIGSPFTYNIKDTKTGISLLPKTETISGSGVTFTNVIASSYRIEAYYGTCTPTYKDTLIANPRRLTVTYPATVNLNCPGDSTSIVISASGSYPFLISLDGITYTYFNTSQGNHTLTNMKAGSYSYYIKDKYDCVFNNGSPITITVSAPPTIVTTLPVADPAKCNSKSSGSVSLNVSGGTSGYTLYLVDALTSKTVITYPHPTGVNVKIPTVPAGTYDLKITDRNGCIAKNLATGIVVNEPDSLIIEIPKFDEIKCFGATTKVTTLANGGWPVAKTLKIEGGGVNSTVTSGWISTLKAGTYTITATNTDLCVAPEFVLTISQPEKLVLDSVKVDNVSCNGANDAKISFSVKGGIPNYLYGLGGLGSGNISFPGTSYIISAGLVANNYNLVIKDDNDCQSNVVPLTITEPAKVEFNVRFDSVTCNGASDGKIIIENANGGNNSFNTYLTRPGGTEQRSNFPLISNLPFGEYKVRITDTKNCTSELKSITIGQPELIVINKAIISDSLSCFNDQDAAITIDAIGGLPYNLLYKVTGKGYQANNSFTNLPSGEFEIWVKNDQGNCETKYSNKLNIINPDQIVVTSVDVTDVSCYNLQDGKVSINAVGGTGTLEYTLLQAPQSIKPNPNGTGRFNDLSDLNVTSTLYNYQVEDRKNCKKTGSFTVLNPSELKIEELDHHQVYCNNEPSGWILIKPTGGSGKYSFKSNSTNSDTLRVSNGEYSKEEDSRIKLLKLTGGDYYPEVIDGHGCKASIKTLISIINPPPLRISDVIIGDKNCFDSDNDSTIIKLDPSDFGTRGTYTFTINNWVRTNETTELQSTFVNVRDTMVYPMVKDVMGCITTFDPKAVKWPDAFNVEIIKRPITCWDNQYGSLITSFKGGTKPYNISVDDIEFTNPVSFNKDVPGEVLKDTIFGNPQNRFFYEGVRTDIYVKDANNCVALNSTNTSEMNPFFFDDYTWDAIDTFEVTDVINTSPNCNYEDASIQIITNNKGEPVYTYWAQYYDFNTNNFAVADSGSKSKLDVPADKILQWFVADKNLCFPFVSEKVDPQGKHQVYIPAHSDTVEVSIKINDDEIPECPLTKDGVVRINVKGFSRDGVEVHIFKTDSTYLDFDTFNPEHKYLISASEKDSSYFHEKENILTGEKVYSDTLYIVTNDSIRYLFSVGYYYIELHDVKTGCFVSTTFPITPKDTICPNNYNLIFSPNSDNENDDWILNNLHLKNASIKIFNSEGEMVYHFPKGGQGFASDGLKWDGFDDKGRPAPIGTYMYVYMMDAVESKVEYGTITLIRGRN